MFVAKVIDLLHSAILITKPRRWGKTVNMQMLKSFFEIEIDDKG